MCGARWCTVASVDVDAREGEPGRKAVDDDAIEGISGRSRRGVVCFADLEVNDDRSTSLSSMACSDPSYGSSLVSPTDDNHCFIRDPGSLGLEAESSRRMCNGGICCGGICEDEWLGERCKEGAGEVCSSVMSPVDSGSIFVSSKGS